MKGDEVHFSQRRHLLSKFVSWDRGKNGHLASLWLAWLSLFDDTEVSRYYYWTYFNHFLFFPQFALEHGKPELQKPLQTPTNLLNILV